MGFIILIQPTLTTSMGFDAIAPASPATPLALKKNVMTSTLINLIFPLCIPLLIIKVTS